MVPGRGPAAAIAAADGPGAGRAALEPARPLSPPSHSQEPALRGGVQLRPHDPTPPSRRQLQHATLPREQWQVCIPDLHAGFITWEEYCRNQETLARNAEAFASLESRRAAPREGAALLQSLMVCGRCGQRMSVHYSKARPARNQPARAYYQCRESCVRRAKGCASPCAPTRSTPRWRGSRSRRSIATTSRWRWPCRSRCGREFEQADAQRALRIQRLEYEAGLAQRRYYAADPANRLVAAPLERNWNERLRELEEATREREQRRTARDEELSARQVRRMEELAADFARVWDAPATGNADRKRLLRLLVEDVTLTRDGYEVIVALRLRGGKALQLDVDLPRPPGLKRPLCPATLALLDDTLDTHSDAEAADVLNAAGFPALERGAVHAAARLPVARSCRHAGTPGAATGPLERAGLPHRQGDGEPVGHRRLDPARVDQTGKTALRANPGWRQAPAHVQTAPACRSNGCLVRQVEREPAHRHGNDPASIRRPSAAPPACGADTRAAVMLVHPSRGAAESVAAADTARQSGRDVL